MTQTLEQAPLVSEVKTAKPGEHLWDGDRCKNRRSKTKRSDTCLGWGAIFTDLFCSKCRLCWDCAPAACTGRKR